MKKSFCCEYAEQNQYATKNNQTPKEIIQKAFNHASTEAQLKGIHKAIDKLIKQSQMPSFELIELAQLIIELGE